MGLVGAYQAAQNNLKSRMRQGQPNKLVRHNGNVEFNKNRLKNAKANLKRMIQEEFEKVFGTEGTQIDCTCFYRKNHAYDFTYHLKGIEQINTHDFSIIGDIIDIDDDTLPISLKNAIEPKIKENVVLVYNIAKRTISLTTPKSGLVIYPYDNDSDSWRKLLGLVGRFIEGLIGTAR
ncbi:MAG: hypothetical protein HUJ83_09940 [Veillonella sp.]|nr:hypothetical protein [Veillonella sp.]